MATLAINAMMGNLFGCSWLLMPTAAHTQPRLAGPNAHNSTIAKFAVGRRKAPMMLITDKAAIPKENVAKNGIDGCMGGLAIPA